MPSDSVLRGESSTRFQPPRLGVSAVGLAQKKYFLPNEPKVVQCLPGAELCLNRSGSAGSLARAIGPAQPENIFSEERSQTLPVFIDDPEKKRTQIKPNRAQILTPQSQFKPKNQAPQTQP
jgi:hypothetical protein